YRALYGDPDFPEQRQFGDSALFLTIHQKLALALRLRAVAGRAPAQDEVALLLEDLRARRGEIEALSGKECERLNLVEDYPDHPKAEAALDDLLNEGLPFWTHPSEIRRMKSAIEEYQDYLPDEKVQRRVRELKKRIALLEWKGEETGLTVILSIFGVGSLLTSISAAKPIPFLVIGALLLTAGIGIQYLNVQTAIEDVEEKQEDVDSKKSSSQEAGSHDATYDTDREARPAGTWQCPNCGNEKEKAEGFKKVMCQKCRREMRFVGADVETLDEGLEKESKWQRENPEQASSSISEVSSGKDALARVGEVVQKMREQS
ncbi:MAG: hypothetical protein ABEJ72_01700, partial [Candidatus Aenigmatarchaeota archaeon]